MRNMRPHRTSLQSALLASILAAGCQGIGVSEQYPQIAAVSQYLMADSSAEIAMARSAAPEAIGRDAAVLILGTEGYRTARRRDERLHLSGRTILDVSLRQPRVLESKIRGPICYNPAAVRTSSPIL